EYSKSELFFKRALSIYEQLAKTDDIEFELVVGNLATLYFNQGRFLESQILLQRSISLLEKKQGQELTLAQRLNTLGAAFQRMGLFAEAESSYRRSLQIRRGLLPADHSDLGQTYNNMAALYAALGRLSEAEVLHKDSLSIREKAYGHNSSEVATA